MIHEFIRQFWYFDSKSIICYCILILINGHQSIIQICRYIPSTYLLSPHPERDQQLIGSWVFVQEGL